MGDGDNIYDIVVVGTGVAGLSAGMYAGRFNLKTLVLGEVPGGLITTTHLVENYPGIPTITGPDMGMVFLEHAKKFGAEILNAKVVDVTTCESPPSDGKECAYTVKTSDGKSYIGKTLVFATGTEYRKLGAAGEERLAAKGVSYCALCDGAFFKGKTVCVVGGGDAAAIESIILSGYAKKIYVFVRKDVLRGEPVNMDKIKKTPSIEIRFKTEIEEILGDQKVDSVKLKSGEVMPVDGVFMAIGHNPLSDLAKKLGVTLDEHGYIKVNVNSETNLPGVYGCGDVTDKPFKQAIIGASEGVMAAYFAYRYLQEHEIAY